MNDNYKANEASDRSERLDEAANKINRKLLEVRTKSFDCSKDTLEYIEFLEDEIREMLAMILGRKLNDTYFRCECCNKLNHLDLQKNLADEYGNYLDIFVCESCKSEFFKEC